MNLEKLNKLPIKQTVIDMDFGFFCVIFKNKAVLQCCLENNKNLEHAAGYQFKFLEAVSAKESGYNQGVCADVNKWALAENGDDDHILEFLLIKAEEIGLDVYD